MSDDEKGLVRLDIGGGEEPLSGYTLVDRRVGKEAYPLDWPDGSVDEVRASHVLEHFGHKQTQDVLKDWVRVLKPGGVLKVAVPNFEWCISEYSNPKHNAPIEMYLMGGQTDENDFHRTLFNRRSLFAFMSRAGVRDIRTWKSDAKDCASLPVSLNLMGVKPPADVDVPDITEKLSIYATMSAPRLGFMANYFCSYQALLPHKIPLKKIEGAFWGQCLQTCMEESMEEGDFDALLTIDYDTIFDEHDVAVLMRLMLEHPEADAIVPIQSKRQSDTPLLTVLREDGKVNAPYVKWERFEPALSEIATGHFGLSLFRTSALKDVPKPWFVGVPNEEGRWKENRLDPDIYFWRNWTKAGKTIYLANHVPVGHCELVVAWPDENLRTRHQHVYDWAENGKEDWVWR